MSYENLESSSYMHFHALFICKKRFIIFFYASEKTS